MNESSLFFVVRKKGITALSKRESYEQRTEAILLPILDEEWILTVWMWNM